MYDLHRHEHDSTLYFCSRFEISIIKVHEVKILCNSLLQQNSQKFTATDRLNPPMCRQRMRLAIPINNNNRTKEFFIIFICLTAEIKDKRNPMAPSPNVISK